jgi:hypothetical protein
MDEPKIKKLNFGEYLVVIKYFGDGRIDVDVLDELGELIEGLYITNEEDNDDFDFNLN